MLQEKDDATKPTTEHNDFVAFVDEHDKRRGTNFLETFPEFAEFYNWIITS